MVVLQSNERLSVSNNVGTWRTSRNQPLEIGYQRRSVMTAGEVVLGEVPVGRRYSARYYDRKAEQDAAQAIIDARHAAKRGRRQRAKANRRGQA